MSILFLLLLIIFELLNLVPDFSPSVGFFAQYYFTSLLDSLLALLSD